jgi:hypothetical protein
LKSSSVSTLALALLLLLAAVGAVSGQGVTGSSSAFQAISVGASPTLITQIRVYTPSLTPGATAALIQLTEQTFTVTGLTTADKVIVNGPVPTALCPPVTFRVSAADTLAIGFSTLTLAICTPAAGTYTVVAIRS